MLSLPGSVRIYLFAAPIDMRNGFDGLAALVSASELDVFSGHLFAFVSRRADLAKVLTWQRGGFVLWYKRLERSRFRLPEIPPGSARIALEADQLTLLLEGIDSRQVKRQRLWEPKRIDRPIGS